MDISEQLSKTGNSIYNDDIRQYIASLVLEWFSNSDSYSLMDKTQIFKDTFLEWIQSSKLNCIEGLHSYPRQDITLGVTQALDQFHYQIACEGRRLRLFRGEYPYNRDVTSFRSMDFIEERPLQDGDAVILSCPFSATGAIHSEHHNLLDEAEKKSIPVFLDMAWFGTCRDLSLDLSHPAIQHVAFSLTKGLTCGNYRSGLRFSRHMDNKDRITLQNKWNHGIHLNTFIGTHVMKQFSPDTQQIKYYEIQNEICEKLQLNPSLCVHIATSDDPKWAAFHRDSVTNRINLRVVIKQLYKKRARTKPL